MKCSRDGSQRVAMVGTVVDERHRELVVLSEGVWRNREVGRGRHM